MKKGLVIYIEGGDRHMLLCFVVTENEHKVGYSVPNMQQLEPYILLAHFDHR